MTQSTNKQTFLGLTRHDRRAAQASLQKSSERIGAKFTFAVVFRVAVEATLNQKRPHALFKKRFGGCLSDSLPGGQQSVQRQNQQEKTIHEKHRGVAKGGRLGKDCIVGRVARAIQGRVSINSRRDHARRKSAAA